MSEPTPARFQCDQCGRKFAWRPEMAGKRAKCPCGNAVVVPAEPIGAAPAAVTPIAAAPMPVVPVTSMAPPPLPKAAPPPPPLPVLPINYMPPPLRPVGKPVGLIIIGVVSIVVGLLSVAASGWSTNLWWNWYTSSTAPANSVASSGPPLPAASVKAYQPGTVRSSGLPADARAKILASVKLVGVHADARRALFDTVLAEFGSDLMKGRDGSALVKLPITGRNREDSDTIPAELVTFRAPGGLVLLYTDRAIYQPSGGRQIVVTNDRFERVGEPTRYTRAAIDAGIDGLRISAPLVTDAQVDFVADKSDTATSVGMLEHEMIFARPVIQKVFVYPPPPGNVLDVVVGREEYFVLPDGRGDRKLAAPYGLDPATGGPVIPAQPFCPQMPGSPKLMRALALYCGGVVVLALFLVIAGIVTLIRPLTGGRLLLLFAVLKLVCIATEVALSFAYFNSIIPNTDALVSYNVDAGRQGVVTTVLLQLILPIAIFIVWRVTGESRQRYRETLA